MSKLEVINRIGFGDHIESNLVYPLDKGYNYICQIDKDWIMSKTWNKKIANKYAIKINDRLYVNHDNTYWLIEKQ